MKWIILRSRTDFDRQLKHFNDQLGLPSDDADTYCQPRLAGDGSVAFEVTPQQEHLLPESPFGSQTLYSWGDPSMLKFHPVEPARPGQREPNARLLSLTLDSNAPVPPTIKQPPGFIARNRWRIVGAFVAAATAGAAVYYAVSN
jgi:hypothetical protein